MRSCEDTIWHGVFVTFLNETLQPATDETTLSTSAPDQSVIDGVRSQARLAFAEAHNAGFYMNSYTTKLNPTMDAVFQRLQEGVRRLVAQ